MKSLSRLRVHLDAAAVRISRTTDLLRGRARPGMRPAVERGVGAQRRAGYLLAPAQAILCPAVGPAGRGRGTSGPPGPRAASVITAAAVRRLRPDRSARSTTVGSRPVVCARSGGCLAIPWGLSAHWDPGGSAGVRVLTLFGHKSVRGGQIASCLPAARRVIPMTVHLPRSRLPVAEGFE